MNQSIYGTITICPWAKTSKAGKKYCEFAVMDKKNVTHTIMAFNEMAQRVSDDAKLGEKITIIGNFQDGKLFMNAFTLEGVMKEVVGRRREAKVEKDDMDELMDVLGPQYVTQAIREVLNVQTIEKIMGFDIAKYKEVKERLLKEAIAKQEAEFNAKQLSSLPRQGDFGIGEVVSENK